MVHRAEQLLIGVRELLKGKLACFDADDDEGGSPSILEELIAEEFEALELEIRQMAAKQEIYRQEIRTCEAENVAMAVAMRRQRERRRTGLTKSPRKMPGKSPATLGSTDDSPGQDVGAPGPRMIRLLLVEDDPFQADAIQVLCEQCGYAAVRASSAKQAISILTEQPDINLVLSDVMMEGTNGFELLCQIRELRTSVSVIMISAYESIDLVEKCILSGADAYLLKPLRMHELRNIWQYVWRRRHEVMLKKQKEELLLNESKPDLSRVQKLRGQRQQLRQTTFEMETEEVGDIWNQLDKLEANSMQQAERSLRSEMRELLLEGGSDPQGGFAITSSVAKAAAREKKGLSPLSESKFEETAENASPAKRRSMRVSRETDVDVVLEEEEEMFESESKGDMESQVKGDMESQVKSDMEGGKETAYKESDSYVAKDVNRLNETAEREEEGEMEMAEANDAHDSGESAKLNEIGADSGDDSDSASSSSKSSASETTPKGDVECKQCKLCEQMVPDNELEHHLVLCTASHSCHERLTTFNRSLKQLAFKIRRRQMAINSSFAKMKATLEPLEYIARYCDQAASVKLSDEADPFEQTYRLMAIRKRAGPACVGGSLGRESGKPDAQIIELLSQVHKLVGKKMDVHWDLISLMDPISKRTTSGVSGTARRIGLKEFALVEPIGSGGYGTVWLARRKRTSDLVAIKVLDKETTKKCKMHSAVMLERDIMRDFNDPYIVTLFFSFSTKLHLCMVMEYLPGGDCCSLIQSVGFFDEPVARFFGAEALLGLEYLHSRGVVHRDIKPQNMLITATGHIKLADFGLSAVDALTHKNHSAKGTPEYLAPEILTRTGHSCPVDFWSLGVVLFQFLVGETPFAAADVQEVYQNILHGRVEIPETEISVNAYDLFSKLLVVDVEKRLGTRGVSELKEHPFFAAVDFSRELWCAESPFKPALRHPEDTSNFQMDSEARISANRLRDDLEKASRESAALKENADESDSDNDGGFSSINAAQLARIQLRQRSPDGPSSKKGAS